MRAAPREESFPCARLTGGASEKSFGCLDAKIFVKAGVLNHVVFIAVAPEVIRGESGFGAFLNLVNPPVDAVDIEVQPAAPRVRLAERALRVARPGVAHIIALLRIVE